MNFFFRFFCIKETEWVSFILCHNHADNQCLFSKVLLLFKYTREEVVDMVRRLPSLLGFSIVTVLQPKYSYLVEVMQRSPKELVRFPHFFSYSLEKRIIPRHQVVGEASQLSRSLSNLYGCNDALFEKKFSAPFSFLFV